MHDDELIAVLQHMADTSLRRSELSAERSFQNSERSLSLLIHSAAALMVLGLSVDRYLLFVHGSLTGAAAALRNWDVGMVMVLVAALAMLIAGLRYVRYVWAFHRSPGVYPGPSAYLAPVFALLTAGGGMLMLVYMLMFTR